MRDSARTLDFAQSELCWMDLLALKKRINLRLMEIVVRTKRERPISV